MKKQAKRLIYQGLRFSKIVSMLETLRTAVGRRHATILNFHRVTDDIPEDGLTINIAKFRKILYLLKRDFHVIGLRDLLHALKTGTQFQKSYVVITFDDGYEDNFLNAYPALQAAELPATFFISTGFIDSEIQTWWDKEINYRPKWMTWEQVREMYLYGFDIGSHTVNHIDLGNCSPHSAYLELSESKLAIEEKLQAPVYHFAYPFGGRQHITDEIKIIIRDCGYHCCLSAYGGYVYMFDSILDLKRLPVNSWIQNAEELGFEINRLMDYFSFNKAK
jgi:peptidoglycan/xylan/chitin deacetylase (PgdA/CDA1 family)